MSPFFKYLLIFVILYPFPCHAIPRLMVSPPIMEIEAHPGAVKTFSLLVGNNGDDECKVRMYTTDLMITKTGSTIFPPAGSSKWSCASWIEVKPKEEILSPNETKMLQCRLAVPRDAVGGRYAVIMVEAVPKTIKGQTPIFWRLSSMILATVKGPGLEKKVSALDFQVKPTEKNKKKMEISCNAKNTGNLYVAARADVVIKNKHGFPVGEKISLSPATGTFLPDTIIEFKGVTKDELPDGAYQAELSFEYNKQPHVMKREIFTVGTVSESEKQDLQANIAGIAETKTTRFWMEQTDVNMDIYAGGYQSKGITIRNEESDEPISVTASIIDYSPELSPYSCKEMLTLNLSKPVLQPHEQQSLKVSARIPKDCQGSKYAKVVIEAAAEGKQPEISICPLIINISKTLQKKAEFVELKAEQLAADKVKITGKLLNKGNTHFQVSGKINIMDDKHTNVAALTVESESNSRILPGEGYTFEVIWEDKEKKKIPKGRYTVEASISYGEKNPLVLNQDFEVKGE